MNLILNRKTIMKALNSLLIVICFLSIFQILTFHNIFDSVESNKILYSTINSSDPVKLIENGYFSGTDVLIETQNIFNLDTILNLRLILLGKASLDHDKSKGENNETLTKRFIIKETIAQNPGITLREIQRATELAMGVIQYHLNRLESQEIETLKFGRCKHFFPCQSHFSHKEKTWLAVIRNINIKTILQFLKSKENRCSQKNIVDFTGISKVMVSYYVKQLRQFGIIDRDHYYLQIRDDYLFISNSLG